jgi:hypothetical protein
MSANEALCYDGCGRPALSDADVCQECADAEYERLWGRAIDRDEELAALAADDRYMWAVGK